MKPQNLDIIQFPVVDLLLEGPAALFFRKDPVDGIQLSSNVSERKLDPPAKYKTPFLYSLLVHLAVLALILGFTHRTQKMAIHNISYLVLDLVSPREARSSSGASVKEKSLPKRGGKNEPKALSAGASFPGEQESSTGKSAANNSETAETEPPFLGSVEPEKTSLDEKKPTRNIFAVPSSPVMGPSIHGTALKHFYVHVNQQVSKLIQDSISEEIRNSLREKRASVRISYGEDGRFEKVFLTPDSDPIWTDILLRKVSWESVVSPKNYSLPHRTVRLHVTLDSQGKIHLRSDLI